MGRHFAGNFCALNDVFFQISNENRRTLRCKTRSGRVVTENRTFDQKPQKARPKKKRGKNLIQTTKAADDFVDRKTLIAFDKTPIGKSLLCIWGLTCQRAEMTKKKYPFTLQCNASGPIRQSPITNRAGMTKTCPYTLRCDYADGPILTSKGGLQGIFAF